MVIFLAGDEITVLGTVMGGFEKVASYFEKIATIYTGHVMTETPLVLRTINVRIKHSAVNHLCYNKNIMTTKKVSTDFRHRLPNDMQAVLNKNKEVLKLWEGLTPLARNEWICWVTIVKKKETREEHLKRLSEDLLRGKRRPCCWPGCPHRRESAQKWFVKKK